MQFSRMLAELREDVSQKDFSQIDVRREEDYARSNSFYDRTNRHYCYYCFFAHKGQNVSAMVKPGMELKIRSDDGSRLFAFWNN